MIQQPYKNQFQFPLFTKIIGHVESYPKERKTSTAHQNPFGQTVLIAEKNLYLSSKLRNTIAQNDFPFPQTLLDLVQK